MKYSYSAFYEKNAAYFNARPNLKKGLLFVDRFLSLAFALAYVTFVLGKIALEFPAEDLIKILFSPALCLFLVSLLRLAICRPRPYSEKGANITPLYQKKGASDHSFPSRHVACAFVIAFTILSYSMGQGICLMVFGLALAYTRFALGWHYPTDLLGGGVLGVLCGFTVYFL